MKLWESADPFFDSGPTSSTIPATSSLPVLRRPLRDVRGEIAVRPDLFPLSRVVQIEVTVAVLLHRIRYRVAAVRH